MQIKKRILSIIVLFFLVVSSLSFFSRPAYAEGTSEEDVYQSVRQNVLSVMEEDAVYGNEWYALDLARDGQDFSPYYLKDLIDTIVTNEGVLDTGAGNYTNYAKAILVLSSLGVDPSDVAGYNLIEKISILQLVRRQGVNGIIYALLALDCRDYDIQVPKGVTTVTRDDYIKAILDAQLEDGGWDWANKKADPDMTAMAIQALAPYYETKTDVKAAVDKALLTLSSLQQEDGGFQTEDAAYAESSESTSMVILALTAMGIDPESDTRFIKNGASTIDNLCSFAVDGGFKHVQNGLYNVIATEQGYRALTAFHRFKEGKPSFYDMSDVGELSKVSSPLTESISISYYDDPGLISEDVALIEGSPSFSFIGGTIEVLADIQCVLADDKGQSFAELNETWTEQTLTLNLPEDRLSGLGQTVIVMGVHDGSVFTIQPKFVDRTKGEVQFNTSSFSTYAVVSNRKADYSSVMAALANIPADLSIYTDESVAALEEAVAAVKEGLSASEQETVDGWAAAIEDAINALVEKEADYHNVDAAIERVPAFLGIYTDDSVAALMDAIIAVKDGLKASDQKKVDKWAAAIEYAQDNLEVKAAGEGEADYTKVADAVKKLPKDLSIYSDEGVKVLKEAMASVKEGMKDSDQETVDGWAKAIEDAILALTEKDADYSKVDEALKKIPVNLSIYTDESVDVLNKAVTAIKEGMKASEQKTVDAWAQALEDAIKNLVRKPVARFNDVQDSNAWFYEYVYGIAETENEKGTPLMSGYKDGSGNFGPTDPLTRQDFSLILYRYDNEPYFVPEPNPYPDADPAGYYFDSIIWARINNIITGYDDGSFGVGDNITREQVATILYRYAVNYKKMDVSAARNKGDLSKFRDASAVSSFAKVALKWANGSGIITGKDNETRIDPQGNAARAEIAAMILRFIEYTKTIS